jgi:DNA integrity scanning protein DisA with diadenylate cyclase activity
MGVLGSDGLTVVNREGVITSTGQIIDLQLEQSSGTSGGGRTQAALAASRYGVVVKVSQDGPVSLFSAGREMLKYNV